MSKLDELVSVELPLELWATVVGDLMGLQDMHAPGGLERGAVIAIVHAQVRHAAMEMDAAEQREQEVWGL